MSASGPATADDFARWRSLAMQMSDETLRAASKACRDAAKAVGTIDTVREGYYHDQMWTFDEELVRRIRRRRKVVAS